MWPGLINTAGGEEGWSPKDDRSAAPGTSPTAVYTATLYLKPAANKVVSATDPAACGTRGFYAEISGSSRGCVHEASLIKRTARVEPGRRHHIIR